MSPKSNTQAVAPTDALAEMAKRIKELEAQNEALKVARASSGKLSLKVSEKGALSVYGMGRFPVTLYAQQWETLLADAQVAVIKAFIVENKSKFSTKADAEARKAATAAAGGTATAPNPSKAF